MGKKASENRRLVLDMLAEAFKDDMSKEHEILKSVLDKYDYMDRQDKAFITYLYEGIIRNRIKLDYVIEKYAKAKKIKPLIRNILRMGIFQILYMDSVPDSAACNEAVNLCIDRGLAGLKGFVNGVLRTIAREKDNIQWPSKADGIVKYLSVYYSMPEWIVEYLLNEYGEDKTLLILESISKPQKVMVRINEKLSSEDKAELLRRIEMAGIEARQHSYLPYAYLLEKTEGMESVPGFNEGLITVQDVSSQLAIDLLPIKDGDYIIDMCAAPGGKTCHAALKAASGHVEARDISEYKLDLIAENAERLGLDNISIGQADATVAEEELLAKADIVILDAPCSGLGVMGKKSDIKYHIKAEDIAKLADIQRKAAKNAISYLKKGGLLLYSTCTITKEENMNNRKWILDNYPVESYDFEADLPEELRNQGGSQGYLQLLPGINKSDGFFISIYRKL